MDYVDNVLHAVIDAANWASEEAKKFWHEYVDTKGSNDPNAETPPTTGGGGVTPPTDQQADSVSGEGTTTDNDKATGEA